MWYQRQQPSTPVVTKEARDQAAQQRFTGDEDIAAQYISLMQADQTAAAQQLFVSRVEAESDVQKKADLYIQNINLALSLQKTDAALEAANRLVSVRASHDSYAQVASVYIARNDVPQQAAFLRKAIDALKTANDVPDKDNLLTLYQSQLAAATEWMELEERNGW